MKTIIIIITLIAFLYSCRTVHKASEDQLSVVNKAKVAASNSLEQKTEMTSEVTMTSSGVVSTSDNGYERLIEEQILEYRMAGKDSLAADADNKVVKTTRKIKEHGNKKDVSVEQTNMRSEFRKWLDSLSDESSATKELEVITTAQRKRQVERTGIPWYAWAGGGVAVSLVFWIKKKYKWGNSLFDDSQIRRI